MPERRLLFVCGGSVFYGAERMALTMMECARQNGWEVECVSSAWTDGRFAREVAALGVRCTPIYLGWLYVTRLDWSLASLLHWPGAAFRFWRAARRFRPDLIVAFGYRPVFQLWPFLRVPVAVSIHDFADRVALRFRFFPRLRQKASRFWACSDAIRRDLIDAGVAPSEISVVMNAVPQSMAAASPERPASRCVRFGLVGRISAGKGQHILLRAVALLASEERSRCEFLFFGDGQPGDVAGLRQEAASLGVAESCTFAGYVGDPSAIYPGIDVLILPVIAPEAFGLVAVEAGLHSIPVIASRLGGLPEIVHDGVGGLLVPPNDPEALCAAIRELLNDPDRRVAMGRRHAERCRRDFSSRRLAANLVQEVNALLTSAASRN